MWTYRLLPIMGLLVSTACSQEKTDLERAIAQLGSARFREREEATRTLYLQRTPAALEHLRKATQSGDLEVRRRAREVMHSLERMLDTERVLAPQKIRFVFKEVQVVDALADFTRRTGFPLQLDDAERKKIGQRTMTLDTGDVPLWEALRLFLDRAGLSEKAPELQEKQEQKLYENVRWRRRVRWGREDYFIPTVTDQIPLLDGKSSRPTFAAGALRIQTVSRPALVGPGLKEIPVHFHVQVEPRFQWQRLVAIRIDRAVDDSGQTLSQPALTVGDMPPVFPSSENVVMWWDSDEDTPRWNSRQGTVRLLRGEKETRLLKELRGRISAEVIAPAAPLIEATEPLKQAGKTFTGPDESRLTIREAVREESGQYRLVVEVVEPKRSMPEMGNRIWINRGVVPLGGTVDVTASEVEQKGLAIHDAEGQPYILASGHYSKSERPYDPRVWTLYYQPRKDQGEPVKLTLSGRRTVLVEVPFDLRDVPIP